MWFKDAGWNKAAIKIKPDVELNRQKHDELTHPNGVNVNKWKNLLPQCMTFVELTSESIMAFYVWIHEQTDNIMRDAVSHLKLFYTVW